MKNRPIYWNQKSVDFLYDMDITHILVMYQVLATSESLLIKLKTYENSVVIFEEHIGFILK